MREASEQGPGDALWKEAKLQISVIAPTGSDRLGTASTTQSIGLILEVSLSYRQDSDAPVVTGDNGELCPSG